MKLLLDQNISARLVQSLSDVFPEIVHVCDVHLTSVDDAEIWRYAIENNCVIVSKDSDFYHRSLTAVNPPKIIWIRRGNCRTREIETIFRQHLIDIEDFVNRHDESLMMLW